MKFANKTIFVFSLLLFSAFISSAQTFDLAASIIGGQAAQCAIQGTDATNLMRMQMRGDEQKVLSLFKEAVDNNDPVAQIELSRVLWGMRWGEDKEKDFSKLSVDKLQRYFYYHEAFDIFNSVFDEAFGLAFDYKMRDQRALETFTKAWEENGYLPAKLGLLAKAWRWHEESYCFAMQLYPYVGQGDREVDYAFGKALKSGSEIGSHLFYKGLYWIETSLGMDVKYPKRQSFEDFKSDYVRFEDGYNTYFDHDGLCFVGSRVVLAPSPSAWEAFKLSKLSNKEFRTPEIEIFAYNSTQLKQLINTYRLSVLCHGSFVKDPDNGYYQRDWPSNDLTHGYSIDSTKLYEYGSGKSLGDISVRKDTSTIHESIRDDRIQPLIDFIETLMRITGSYNSVYSAFRQIQDR